MPTNICIPESRCESCPMNDILPEDQFTPAFYPGTNEVAVMMTGDDVGTESNGFKRFQQKIVVGHETQFTVQAGLCEPTSALGAVVDESVCTVVHNGVRRAGEIISRSSRPLNHIGKLLQLELSVIGLQDELQRQAMSSVIIRQVRL